MTAGLYEPWISNNMHITKFAKHLDERQEYLSTNGIKTTDAVKLQFYLEQMIDNTMFSKHAIIRWEKQDNARKTWPKSRNLKKETAREEMYAHLVGSTDIEESDEHNSDKITGILRRDNTTTGRHPIWASPFTACKIVSPREKSLRPPSRGEHFRRSSLLAAA